MNYLLYYVVNAGLDHGTNLHYTNISQGQVINMYVFKYIFNIR